MQIEVYTREWVASTIGASLLHASCDSVSTAVLPAGLKGLLDRSHVWLRAESTSVRSWASLSSLKVSVMQAEATHQSVLPFMCSLTPLQRWGNPLPQFQQSLHRLRSATSEEAGFLQMSCTAQKHPGNNFHCFRTLLSLPGGPVLRGGECKVLFPNGYIHTHAHAEQIN